jgi:hypothetical protein
MNRQGISIDRPSILPLWLLLSSPRALMHLASPFLAGVFYRAYQSGHFLIYCAVILSYLQLGRHFLTYLFL